MRRQYKASYLDNNVFDSITNFRKANEFKYKVPGLPESLSTFDNPTSVHSLLAVANNIITSQYKPKITKKTLIQRTRIEK